ncbi:type II toxin-antitoxin system HicB family antitoxin [Pseudanabaena mucicola]|uniref:Type II toxin-antitoxin system HicB family antitoxin n=1 Tax=Pseudanabaena mucicola FACHB-723 TaxID=2692860 RepID=A0ABR7ZT00_9CYAN|nr:type II toxin-antitoxin system HicB family antitoxin [Pseudanabaena mucicola]MBD2186937.1 type II toxin-antitoxin system HicB family antitoxin [Pseudanabaena mucicola FACHB-723]
MPHDSMVIIWSEEDDCYLVHLPDFPFQKFHTHSNTYEEAAKHGQEVIDSYLEIYREDGKSLPQPKNSSQLLRAA